MKRRLKTKSDAVQGKQGGVGGFDPAGGRIVYTAYLYNWFFRIQDK